MLLSDPAALRDLLVPLTAAVAVFCAALALGWPWLAGDPLGPRIRKVLAGAGPQPAPSAPEDAVASRPALLGREPRKIYAAIVDRLNLARHLEDGATVERLRMAGFRGRAPVVAFLALRVLMPVVMTGIAAFYAFVVIRPDLPVPATGAAVLLAGGLGHYLPALYVTNRITKRQLSISRTWPDALDLLLICVESGMSAEHAFRKVAGEIRSQSRELADELTLTTAELAFLPDRRAAYENLGRRTNLDGVRAVVSGLTQAEQYGTSLGHALRVLAQEGRALRMSEAEKKAAALSPKLTVPMILFFLPVLFAVIVTPAVIQIVNN